MPKEISIPKKNLEKILAQKKPTGSFLRFFWVPFV